MKYKEFNICDKNGKSNCVIRSLCKILNKNYDDVYNELLDIAKRLNNKEYNDIEAFEDYMKKYNILPIKNKKNSKIKDLVLDNGKYIIFCWDKLERYHMVTIINNILYDKNSQSLDMYAIRIYKEK